MHGGAGAGTLLLSLLVAAAVAGGHARTHPMGTVMSITARGLRAAGRPDMVLDYADQPLCGRAGPELLPFGRERLAVTPYRVRMGVDESRVAACALDVSPAARARYAELAAGRFCAVFMLDGLEADCYPLAMTSNNVTLLAAHIDLVLHARSAHNGTVAELVKWGVRTTGSYVPLEAAGHAWTYSVTWLPTTAARVEEGGFSADASGAQLIGIGVCIFFTLAASSAITATVRRLVAPHLIPGASVLCPSWLWRARSVSRDAVAAPSTADELVVLMSDAPTDPDTGKWRMLADDVFRSPPAARVMCVLTGAGVHALATAALTVAVCVAGMARAAGTLVWLLAMPAGIPAGYAAAHVRVALGALPSKRDVVASMLCVPVMLAGCVLAINTALAAEASDLAAPPLTLLWLTCAWAVPTGCATIVGYAIHARVGARPHRAPRASRPTPAVPRGPLAPIIGASMVVCGSVFMGAAAPAYTLLNTVWLGLPLTAISAYVMIAMGLLAWCTLVAACSLLITYTVLESGNWNWAPYAFCVPASSGIMVAVFAGGYYLAGSFIGTVGAFVFACEAAVIAACLGVAAGALSLLFACRFVAVLYTTSHCA